MLPIASLINVTGCKQCREDLCSPKKGLNNVSYVMIYECIKKRKKDPIDNLERITEILITGDLQM